MFRIYRPPQNLKKIGPRFPSATGSTWVKSPLRHQVPPKKFARSCAIIQGLTKKLNVAFCFQHLPYARSCWIRIVKNAQHEYGQDLNRPNHSTKRKGPRDAGRVKQKMAEWQARVAHRRAPPESRMMGQQQTFTNLRRQVSIAPEFGF